MKPKDIEVLKQIVEYEDTASARDLQLGWSWRDVRIWPATLNRMVVNGLPDTAFKSNSYTGYRLTDKARATLTGGKPALVEEEALPVPWSSPRTRSRTSWATTT